MLVLGRKAEITVIDRGTVLGKVAPSARRKLLEAAAVYGIALADHAEVREVTPTALRLSDGREIPSDFTIGAAGAVPHPWLTETGLDLHHGYITVDEQLRSTSHSNIYAAGDCAHLSHAPRPKAGVYAVRAAPILAHNLRADLTGLQRRAFRPQRDFLKLISLGQKQALAEKAGITLAGDGMWRWKNRIDQGFMDKFHNLPSMPTPAAPNDAAKGVAAELAGPMPCGGCGAKLGPEALSTTLASLSQAGRDDVETAPGDDAAVLRIGGQRQVLTTDHLRAFTDDPVLMARIAAVHALGDIWAMGAKPQAATATVILPRMATRMQGAWLDEIMQAASEVFTAEGAEIVGGHSSMGSELTLGFTITGLLDRPAITLDGAEPGDALILTKPIGSGTLLAAEMRGLARGAEVADLWAAMQQGQAQASTILSPVARAMTDVTGFGLAGHLANICRASGVGAELHLDAIPLYPGALRLAEAGVRSTLFAQNRAALSNEVTAPNTPLADLVFDPQTAGGLLAAVPADTADALSPTLAAAGLPASRIGRITDGPVRITMT
jgi:selenide,water dikinase